MNFRIAIIGAGPAGLMAAEVLAQAGCSVDVFDAMPTAGRKFLMAGRGGLNLTHSEPTALFLTRFQHGLMQPIPVLLDALKAFDGIAVRDWADTLGADTFVGTSGRVFPRVMKAAPLLRAWLYRLQGLGVQFHMRHRWLGWDAQSPTLCFMTAQGEKRVVADRTVLALGGGSWPRLGADGCWQAILAKRGIGLTPLKPANCGFETGWSTYLCEHVAGQVLKHISLSVSDPTQGGAWHKRGDVVVTGYGLEGGALYALSAMIRDLIDRDGSCTVYLDLLPERSLEAVLEALSHPRGSRSWSSFLQSRLQLPRVKRVLLQEIISLARDVNPEQLACHIKSLPICLSRSRPLAEAISSAGGVQFESLDADFQMKAMPGVFCAGEMLDWEAPTGGYLLTGCLATGRAAGLGILKNLGLGT